MPWPPADPVNLFREQIAVLEFLFSPGRAAGFGLLLEMSKSSWLVAGMIPGVDRQPVKKLPKPNSKHVAV